MAGRAPSASRGKACWRLTVAEDFPTVEFHMWTLLINTNTWGKFCLCGLDDLKLYLISRENNLKKEYCFVNFKFWVH